MIDSNTDSPPYCQLPMPRICQPRFGADPIANRSRSPTDPDRQQTPVAKSRSGFPRPRRVSARRGGYRRGPPVAMPPRPGAPGLDLLRPHLNQPIPHLNQPIPHHTHNHARHEHDTHRTNTLEHTHQQRAHSCRKTKHTNMRTSSSGSPRHNSKHTPNRAHTHQRCTSRTPNTPN
jgi:hypothetical protein